MHHEWIDYLFNDAVSSIRLYRIKGYGKGSMVSR